MIGYIYIKSTVVLISQLKGAVHPLVLTDQGISTSTPPCFIIHNLNHVSAFSYSCFVLPRLAIAYLSLHLTLHWCVDLSTASGVVRLNSGSC